MSLALRPACRLSPGATMNVWDQALKLVDLR